MDRMVKIALGVVVVLAVAGGSFYGGRVYRQPKAQYNSTAAGK